MDPHQWFTIIAERDGRHHTIHTGVKNFESSHQEALGEKRQKRKKQGYLHIG